MKNDHDSRKANPTCPKCGRKHHQGNYFTGLLRANKRRFKND